MGTLSRSLMKMLGLGLLGGVLLTGMLWALDLVRFGNGSGSADAQAETAAVGTGADGRFSTDVPPAPTGGPSVVDYGRLEARLAQLMQEDAMVGLAVAVVENGEVRFVRGFGETVAGSGTAVTPGTVFRWASLSKGVAADMVAVLAARQRLSLNDPVNRWSATLRLPGGGEAQATVADLLSHRLGIHGHAHDARLEGGEDPAYLRQLLAFLPTQCAPGQCHSYQNVAYDASSEVVERVLGVPFEQALREQLFLPLGMTTASASRQALLSSPNWAQPHRGGRTSRPIQVSEPYYRVAAAGGVNGSIMDLALWMRAQMGLAPQVLPAEALNAVQTPRVATPGETRRRRRYFERTPNSAYGLGWRVFDYAGNRVVGHHGGVAGYRSLILFDPARRSGVVALWNSATGRPNGIEYEVMDALYQLPFRDWLELGEGGAVPVAVEEDMPETEGQLQGADSSISAQTGR